jgi:hypothetical protein
MFQVERQAVQLQFVFFCENLAGNGARRSGQEIIIPILDPLNPGEMLAGIVLGDDLGAGRMQPCVAIGMIEVPMGVDQVRDLLVSEPIERFGELRARYADAGIDHDLAILAGENGDIAAGSLEYADVVSQSVRRDRRSRGAVFDQADQTAGFREGLARRQPSAQGGSTADAAQAKVPPRQQIFRRCFHDILAFCPGAIACGIVAVPQIIMIWC